MSRLGFSAVTLFGLVVAGTGCSQHTPSPALPAPIFARQPQFAAISVADLETMAAWYERVLDVKRKNSASWDGGGNINLANDSLFIELVSVSEARSLDDLEIERAFQVHGVYKIGFFVADLDAAIERLEELDVPLHGRRIEMPEQGIRFIQILDPEGNIVQLFEQLD